MTLKETNNEVIIESLERLKRNADFAIIKDELIKIQKTIDWMIYNEQTSDDLRFKLVMRSNLIKSFIELPDDLLNQFTLTPTKK